MMTDERVVRAAYLRGPYIGYKAYLQFDAKVTLPWLEEAWLSDCTWEPTYPKEWTLMEKNEPKFRDWTLLRDALPARRESAATSRMHAQQSFDAGDAVGALLEVAKLKRRSGSGPRKPRKVYPCLQPGVKRKKMARKARELAAASAHGAGDEDNGADGAENGAAGELLCAEGEDALYGVYDDVADEDGAH